jgi:predicted ATPase/class 3 adenylate cyclase
VLPSGDVTFLMTDIEASTLLLRDIGEDSYAVVLDETRALQQLAAERNGGVLARFDGDACFFAFPSSAASIKACEDMQSELRERALTSDHSVHVRMGLHRGHNVRPVDDDYATLSVHQTARVADAAHGGQVLLTADVASAANDRCSNLGLFNLRDFDGPTPLYALNLEGGERATRRPRALATGEASFPRYRTTFVGRTDDLTKLRKAVRDSRLVTLVGPGGAGKTRLVVETSHHLTGVFAATWFVDLLHTQRDVEIQEAFRAAIADVSSATVEPDPIRSVAAVLGNQRALFVFDNCEHVLDAAADYIDELLSACPSVHVLTTTREPLDLPDERLIVLDGLALPADATAVGVMSCSAGQLFVDRAEQVTTLTVDDKAAATIASLIQSLDGLPLALELVAAMTLTHSLDELSGAVRDELASGEDVTAHRKRGRPERHLSLRAVIDWSARQLDASSRQALAALALTVPPTAPRTAYAALRPLGLAGRQATNVIADLIRRSLVVRELDGADSVRLLETVRTFAVELADLDEQRTGVLHSLAEDCIAAAGEQLLTYSSVSDDFERVAPTALMLFEREDLPATVRQRLGWSFAPWFARFSPRRLAEHLDQAIALDDSDPALLARLYQSRAFTASNSGDAEAAERYLEVSAQLLDAVDDASVRETHDYIRTALHVRAERTQAALDMVEQYVDRPESRIPRHWQYARALAHATEGHYAEAETMLRHLAETPVRDDLYESTLFNLANAQAQLQMVQPAIENVLAFIDLTRSSFMKTLAVDIIATALAAHRLTPDVYGLELWHVAELEAAGYAVYEDEIRIRERMRERAMAELSEGERIAAVDLAGRLDPPSAFEYAVRLAREYLDSTPV